MSGQNAPAQVTGFYAATHQHGRTQLLLGPFTEKGIALTAVDAARDLLYVTRRDLGPVPAGVEVTEVTMPGIDLLPAGELNDVALHLHGS
ncbi:hypothetical protein [Cellulosimicrobium sp. Marseille-Q4280]|uniref:hypothetical protein n=1 Tax=Cellulosimicrobium sp. Marseille-Q4280 TaxID=2937992 RepID=UPI0020402775|nr:hypothetical protein [Cellulosimicrobium sp. Marseille-Q4280]